MLLPDIGRVWFICAKIQFESNSQPVATVTGKSAGCGLSVRRYNLKAIHNNIQPANAITIAVVYLCEDTIYSQFTAQWAGSTYKFRGFCARIVAI